MEIVASDGPTSHRLQSAADVLNGKLPIYLILYDEHEMEFFTTSNYKWNKIIVIQLAIRGVVKEEESVNNIYTITTKFKKKPVQDRMQQQKRLENGKGYTY